VLGQESRARFSRGYGSRQNNRLYPGGKRGYRYEFFRGYPEVGFRGSERGVWISEILGVLPRGLYCSRYEIRHDFLEKPVYRNREMGRISYRGIRKFNEGY